MIFLFKSIKEFFFKNNQNKSVCNDFILSIYSNNHNLNTDQAKDELPENRVKNKRNWKTILYQLKMIKIVGL